MLSSRKVGKTAYHRRSTANAIVNGSDGSDRSRSGPVADKPLHPHAGHNQVDLERRGSNRGGAVAPEYFRTLQFLRPHPRRLVALRKQFVLLAAPRAFTSTWPYSRKETWSCEATFQAGKARRGRLELCIC